MQLEALSPPSSQTFRTWGPLTPGLVAFAAFCCVVVLPLHRLAASRERNLVDRIRSLEH